MNRKSGNVSKTKKLISRPGSGSKAIRKSYQKLSDSSSTTSNKNSSERSEDIQVYGAYSRTEVNKNSSYEEEELLRKKLQEQLKELRHKLKILEEAHENKDFSLNALTREKERAIGEIRRLEKCNKLLRQQLNDERNHYMEEKEKFFEEMTRFKKRLQEAKLLEEKKQNEKWNLGMPISRQSLINQQFRWQFNKEKGDFSDNNKTIDQKMLDSQKQSGMKERVTKPMRNVSCSDSQLRKSESFESWHLYEGNDLSLQMAALKTENAKLRSIICERDERNYELCLRFLRMKHCKNDIRTRFQDLENEYLQVITNLMEKIDEARHEFNFIIDQKFKRPLHSTNAMYLQLVQRNSRMAFENASLRLQNQCLKKELNKYVNSISSNEKKIDRLTLEGEQPLRLQLTDSRSGSKINKIKKNVNFKEIQTIYERKSSFNNSDTDSNYMSKTSTTVPSNGSLADPKSNESIIKYATDMPLNRQKKFHSQFPNSSAQNHRSWLFSHQDKLGFSQSLSEAKPLSDDILSKIFKRVDTSSCHSDSSRSKDLKSEIKDKIWEKESKLDKKNCLQDRVLNNEINKGKESFRMCANSDVLPWKTSKGTKLVMEKNKFQTRKTNSSSLHASKESLMLDCKNAKDVIQLEQKHGVVESNKLPQNIVRNKLTRTKLQSQKSGTFRNQHSENRNNFSQVSKIKLDTNARVLQSNKQRQTLDAKSNLKIKEMKDSCGLEEKVKVSELELPLSESKKKVEENRRVVILEKEKKKETEQPLQEPIGLVKSYLNTDKSNLNLHHHLLSARNSQFSNNDRCSEGDGRQRSAKTYRIEKNNSVFFKDVQYATEETSYSTKANQETTEVKQPRRQEGSKRFSHRLISTSPEQLRSILTESQLEACYKMAPTIVGQALTEMNTAFYGGKSGNEIILQLVIPAADVEKNSQLFSDKEIPEKSEKNQKALEPSLAAEQNLADVCLSDIQIPLSNLPTSSSTLDLIDSAVNDNNHIILRTLSAPGLLESSWLDPYIICEMRDSSTNT